MCAKVLNPLGGMRSILGVKAHPLGVKIPTTENGTFGKGGEIKVEFES